MAELEQPKPPQSTEPIPLSRSVIWDDFRQSYLPAIVLSGTIAGVACLWSAYVTPKPISEAPNPSPPTPALTNGWPKGIE